jgi:hypothetical protein
MLRRAEDIEPKHRAASFRLSFKEIQNGIDCVCKLVLPRVAEEPVGAPNASSRARLLHHLVAQAPAAESSERLDDEI